MSLESERGIFIVTCFRIILMKTVYQDKYKIIDRSMSDSNVGARKKKSIQNHIFVINGIRNAALNNKSKNIDIQIMDYCQCFDSMWLKECINDLYTAGVTDDSLAEETYGIHLFNYALADKTYLCCFQTHLLFIDMHILA